MKNVSKFSRTILLFFVLLGVLAAAPNCSLTEVVSSVDDGQDDVAGKPLFAIGNEKGKPTGEDADIIAPGWKDFPIVPEWGYDAFQKSPFERLGSEEGGADYFKAIPAPDGGIYLFISGLVVSSSNGNIYVEHYDKDLNFITSPDLGLHLLGFPPYVEKHSLALFDVLKDGENYYLAFDCWDHKHAVFLMKYDKDLKPLYRRPVFIDYGCSPALVKANSRIYVLYAYKYRDAKKKTRHGIFKMTVVETQHKIDGEERFFAHRIHREMLPLDTPKDALYPTAPHVVYNPAQKEFCLIYNAIKREYLWGDHIAQIFDANWKKKGPAVNLYDYFSEFREKERHDSVIPAVALHNGRYIFSTDGQFKFRKKGIPKEINSVAIIKCDKGLKKIAVRPIYGKMLEQNGRTKTLGLGASHIFNYGDGLAVIGSAAFGGALLYKLDGDLNVKSATVLKGGIPRKSDLFVNPCEIEKYPPRGILGCSQLLRIPVDNRGLATAKKCNIEMYYQNKKVASGSIDSIIHFSHRVTAELKWTVPEKVQTKEIEVQIKLDPEKRNEEFTRANNTISVKLPVWDKGMVRGYVQDGSLGVIDWLPLESAKVTLTAPGYSKTSTTDRRGYYEFDRVPFGNYHVKIEKAGYNAVEDDRKLSKAIPVATVGDKLDNHGRFEVEVKPAKALKRCEVMLSGGKFSNIDAERGESGKFVADVPAGKYKVKIKSPGYVPCQNTDVQINLGRTTSIAVTLEEATYSIVSGRVCDMYGDPVPNTTITFRQAGWGNDDNAPQPQYATTSDETGKFTITLTGYRRKTVRYKDSNNKWRTKIERGDAIKGTVSWKISAVAPGKPAFSQQFSARAGYEETCNIYLCDPKDAPKNIGIINVYVPWTAEAHFPGFMNYPSMNAYAWYGIFAAGLRVDYNPKKDEILSLYTGVQGLAYEMHAVSGKITVKKKSSPRKGWKKWGKTAVKVGRKLIKLKKTLEDEPESSNEVPTAFDTAFKTLRQNLGPTLFIPGVDKHKTSVRVDLIQIIGTDKNNKGRVLWSTKKQWFSHDSHDDEFPNSHIKEFKVPKGINRKKVKIVVYLKLQKLSLDGASPTGPVPFYTNQHIKIIWNPGNNKMNAHYVPEYEYLGITGLSFD